MPPTFLKIPASIYQSKDFRHAVTALLLSCWFALGFVASPAVLAQHKLVAPNGDLAAFMSQESKLPLLISAHRGGPKPGFPENAIETFEEATYFAPMIIEMDIRTSKDGVLLLMHDRKLDRTTTGSGFVGETLWADMKNLQLKDNDGDVTDFRIPTLAQALEWAKGRAILSLDIKRGTNPADVIKAVADAQAFDRAIAISYSLESALELQSLSDQLVITASAGSGEGLIKLQKAGLDFNRTIIWTGTRLRSYYLYDAIKPTGSLAQIGTLGFNEKGIDRVIAKSGDDSRYMTIFNLGIDIIATDRYWAVAKAAGFAEMR